ncbi:hypothetical protein CAPTEDRAFT_126903, partial [Capitella teleta]
VWPLSLLAFRQAVFSLALDRSFSPPAHRKGDISTSGQCLAMEHCLRKHVKPKKQHEIIHLSETISDLTRSVNCDHVVDIGAGQGHLSRCLNFAYGLKVTTIEASACHQPKAKKFDQLVYKCSLHEIEDLTADLTITPEARHLVGWIEPDISVEEFLQRLEMNSEEECRFALAGLHACGDLSATLLKLFVACPNVCAIASVGCCYMKMSTQLVLSLFFSDLIRLITMRSVNTTEFGYPLSKHLQHLPNGHLSWEARELGVHFADAYHDRLLSECLIRSHAYRAALQEVIHLVAPSMQHGAVKLTFKNLSDISFEQYASQALQKLGLDAHIPEDLLSRAKEDRLPRWREVVGFFTLRLSLAPLIESLILVDRALYLEEHGEQS